MTRRRARHLRMSFGPFAIAVVVLLIISLTAGTVANAGLPALMQTEPPTVIVATDRLNVRSGPGLGHPVVRAVFRGDVYSTGSEHVGSDGYTWSTIRVADAPPIGWVADQYLTTDTSSGGDVAGRFAAGDRVVTTARLNFRASPGTGGGVIRLLATGSVLILTDGPVSASGYTWYQGRTTQATGGDTGWVIQDGLAPAEAELPDPGIEYSEGSMVHVATESLRLRSGPGTSAAIVARLPQSTTLTIAGEPIGGDGYSWYPVHLATGASGWVAGDYLAPGAGEAGDSSGGAAGGAATVDTPRLNLRAGPGTDQDVIAILTSGTPLTIVEGSVSANGYHWYRVETDGGATGWVIGEGLAQ